MYIFKVWNYVVTNPTNPNCWVGSKNHLTQPGPCTPLPTTPTSLQTYPLLGAW